jgi:hypothetical protein
LILLKPTGQIAHQGGVRFRQDSREYELLRAWIAAGATGPISSEPQLVRLEATPRQQVLIGDDSDSIALRVTAHFEDGDYRDVTGAGDL